MCNGYWLKYLTGISITLRVLGLVLLWSFFKRYSALEPTELAFDIMTRLVAHGGSDTDEARYCCSLNCWQRRAGGGRLTQANGTDLWKQPMDTTSLLGGMQLVSMASITSWLSYVEWLLWEIKALNCPKCGAITLLYGLSLSSTQEKLSHIWHLVVHLVLPLQSSIWLKG